MGRLLVERDSSISGERDDLEAAAGWLLENGYIQEPLPAENIPEAEQQEPEETEADTVSETISDHGVTTHCISLPLAGFTPDSLKNLIRTLYAGRCLRATGSESSPR